MTSSATPSSSPLARPQLGRLLKFALVGGSGVVVNLGIFHLTLLLLAPVPFDAWRNAIAYTLGIVVSIFTNFLLNDTWTWGDRAKGHHVRALFARLGRYYLTCALSGAVQLGVSFGSFYLWFQHHPLLIIGRDVGPSLAALAGILAGIAINLPVSHYWTFKDEPPQISR